MSVRAPRAPGPAHRPGARGPARRDGYVRVRRHTLEHLDGHAAAVRPLRPRRHRPAGRRRSGRRQEPAARQLMCSGGSTLTSVKSRAMPSSRRPSGVSVTFTRCRMKRISPSARMKRYSLESSSISPRSSYPASVPRGYLRSWPVPVSWISSMSPSPAILTYPPKGMADRTYSVSPQRLRANLGPIPMEKVLTKIPKSLQNRKCPSSWTKMTNPRPMATTAVITA